MFSKDKRLLDPTLIPSSMWDPASETLILPLDLKNIYKRIIHDNKLLNLALSRDRNSCPPVGGGDKEKTDQHFAQAFDSSVARAQLSLLDPKNDITPTSNVYLSVLAGNKLSLIDAPCGAGAAAFSFLANIAELRAKNVLPRMSLDVFFIAAACEAYPNGIVRYVDIKKFYPSIKTDTASKTWLKYCEITQIPKIYTILGEKLIDEHSKISIRDNNGKGILTGPMFSHLISNLILKELDEKWATSVCVRYFRYVDDITLVGNEEDVTKSFFLIKAWLGDLGLELHDESSPKTITTTTIEWNKGRHDFKNNYENSWGDLIFDLNQFLLFNYKDTDQLKKEFLENNIRIPVRDYANAVLESSYLEKVNRWIRYSQYWFKRKGSRVTIDLLLKKSKYFCNTLKDQFDKTFDECKSADSFHRKRFISKLRYYCSRLVFLASEETLSALSLRANEFPELIFHAEVMNAVASGNIDRVLAMGTNAAQAAAQPMRAANRKAETNKSQLSDVEKKSMAIFLLNGVSIKNIPESPINQSKCDLVKFSIHGSNIDLMRNGEPFIRELSCLHGITEKPRHPELLEKLFDEDENLIMDIIDNLQYS